jgi:hypothetical protein
MTIDQQEFLDKLCADLTQGFQVHTILLYGSRANGTSADSSDYDVAAFGPVPRVARDARVVDGQYIDTFVYPENHLATPTEEHLKLRGSRVLLQRAQHATSFLNFLNQIHSRGPIPLPNDELVARRIWARKMQARIERGDAEGNFRRVWLLTALLEDYFHLRGQWYEGPKRALQWLAQHDPETRAAFERALEPNATMATIRRLVDAVIGADRDQGAM